MRVVYLNFTVVYLPSEVAQVELPLQFPASVERERAASDPVLGGLHSGLCLPSRLIYKFAPSASYRRRIGSFHGACGKFGAYAIKAQFHPAI